MSNASTFDGFEIAACFEAENYTVEPIETQEQFDDHGRTYWTLYGHLPGAGVVALTDCGELEQALQILRWLYGHPASVHDTIPRDVEWGRFYFDAAGRPK